MSTPAYHDFNANTENRQLQTGDEFFNQQRATYGLLTWMAVPPHQWGMSPVAGIKYRRPVPQQSEAHGLTP